MLSLKLSTDLQQFQNKKVRKVLQQKQRKAKIKRSQDKLQNHRKTQCTLVSRVDPGAYSGQESRISPCNPGVGWGGQSRLCGGHPGKVSWPAEERLESCPCPQADTPSTPAQAVGSSGKAWMKLPGQLDTSHYEFRRLAPKHVQ